MQVIAFATARQPDWRWRIVDYAGDMIEESSTVFPTIAAAVGAGTERLQKMDVVDRSVRVNPYRRTRYLRSR
jgi:hypothetical protein